MSAGCLVAVEGCDGAGKTSIRKYLFTRLRDAGATPLTITRYCYLDVAATEVLTAAKWHRAAYPPEELLAALVADKRSTSRLLLEPHLAVRHVIADRFVASDMVDNLALRGIPPDRTLAALRAAGVRLPDITVFVTTPPDVAGRRKAARGGDAQNWWDVHDVQRRLYAGFQQLLAGGDGARTRDGQGTVVQVDNAGSFERTRRRLDEAVLDRLLAS